MSLYDRECGKNISNLSIGQNRSIIAVKSPEIKHKMFTLLTNLAQGLKVNYLRTRL